MTLWQEWRVEKVIAELCECEGVQSVFTFVLF